MNITIPSELTPLEAINFANYIENRVPEDDEYTYDFKDMQHCRPFGLLVVASAIRKNMGRFPNAKHIPINTNGTQGCAFAATFGFFQSIGFDIGDFKEEGSFGNRYIPIKRISANDLHARFKGTSILNEKVDYQANEFANLLANDKSTAVKDALQYCFREIMRNTFEHGESDCLWVCGQFWPSRNEAEIAILDDGIGIFKSLQSNPRINVTSCKEALNLAVQPGLSRTLGDPLAKDDMWQNSGYGLYVASTLTAICNGYFILCSGDTSFIVNGTAQQYYDSSHSGTVVGISIDTNNRHLKNFKTTLTNIVAEGETRAKSNADKRILSASKITSIASMIQHIKTTNKIVDQSKTMEAENESNQLVPRGEVVTFKVCNCNPRGEILGWFDYNGERYDGKLINVNAINRKFYCADKRNITAIVRKFNGVEYILFEPQTYEKIKKK